MSDQKALLLGPESRLLKGTWPPKFLPENIISAETLHPHLRLFTLQESSWTFIMARPKKVEEKPKDSGSLQISVEDFVRTRNSVSFVHLLRICRDSTPSFSQLHRVCQQPPSDQSLPPYHHACKRSTSALHDRRSMRRGTTSRSSTYSTLPKCLRHSVHPCPKHHERRNEPQARSANYRA